MSTSLVPYKQTLPAQYVYEFKLSDEEIEFMDRETVKAKLPDILGRALARSWIDEDYRLQLEKDVASTLAAGGVAVPDEYECRYEKNGTGRAKIVVYEVRPNSAFRLRICGFSLTMMASK